MTEPFRTLTLSPEGMAEFRRYLHSPEGRRSRAERLQRDLADLHAELTGVEPTKEANSTHPDSPTATATAPELVRASDVGMTRREWRAAVRRGELRAQKIGREYAAKRADFDAYLAARRVEPELPKQRPRRAEPAEAAVERALAAGQLRSVRGPKR